MHRDWDQTDSYPSSLGNDHSSWALKAKVGERCVQIAISILFVMISLYVKVLLVELLVATREFLTCNMDEFEGVAEQILTVKKDDLLDIFEHDINLNPSRHAQVGEQWFSGYID